MGEGRQEPLRRGQLGWQVGGWAGRFLGTSFSKKEKLKSFAESREEEGRKLENRLKV